MKYNKALVEVYIPAVGKSYDVYIPLNCKLHIVVKLMCDSFSKLCQDKLIPDKNSVLCDAETGIIYNLNAYVHELNIRNGSRLLFI